MDENRLRLLLDGAVPLVYKDETCSTNDDAKILIAKGLVPGLVVARRQTAGRGRRGNVFQSPKGGIYMSLVVPAPAETIELLTSFLGVCVCKVLEETCGLRTSIKWVNDIYVGGKKLAGILAEHIDDKVVVGIGINGYITPCLDSPMLATSLVEHVDSPNLEMICVNLTDRVLTGLSQGIDARGTVEYCRKHSVLLGREVTYIVSGVERHGVAIDLTRRGELVIYSDAGIERLDTAVHDVKLAGI